MSRVRARRDITTVVRVCLMAAALVTPAVFDLGSVKPFDLVKLTTVLFFGWLAFGTWIAAVVLGRARPRRFTMGWLAGAFLLVSTVATIFSPTKLTSIFGWYGRHHGLITTLIFVVIFYVVASLYRERPERAYEIVYAIGLGASVITLYILIQFVGWDPIRWARPSGGDPGLAYFGTMGNANFAGGFIGLTMPWLYLAFRRTAATWLRVVIVVWGAAEVLALYLTSARNGIVALGAAVLTFGFIYRKRVPLVAKLGAALAVCAGLVLAVLIVFHPGSQRPPEWARGVDILRSTTVKVRGHWWLAGLKMGADRPIFGWGPDTYVTMNARYLEDEAAKLGDSEIADKPHNVFVEHFAHLGILGLGTYLALLFFAFRRAFRRLREAGRAEARVIETLVMLLTAYIAQAFFSIDVTAIGLVGWLVLGLIAALADPPVRTAAEGRPDFRRSPTSRRALAGVAVASACLLAAVSNAPLKGDHEAHTAGRMGRDEPVFIPDVIDHYEKAKFWAPFVPQYRSLAGAFLDGQARRAEDVDEKRDLFERSLEWYNDTPSMQPGYPGWVMAVGKQRAEVAAAGGDATFNGSLDLLDRAERLAPLDWRIRVYRGDVLLLWARTEEELDERPGILCRGLAQFEEAIELRPKASEAWNGKGRALAQLGHLDEAISALRRSNKFDRLDTNTTNDQLIEAIQDLKDADEPPPVVSCDDVSR